MAGLLPPSRPKYASTYCRSSQRRSERQKTSSDRQSISSTCDSISLPTLSPEPSSKCTRIHTRNDEVLRRLAKQCLNCEVRTFFAWGHLKQSKTSLNYSVPSKEVIDREKMIMDFEKKRQTHAHQVPYKDFYAKLKQ